MRRTHKLEPGGKIVLLIFTTSLALALPQGQLWTSPLPHSPSSPRSSAPHQNWTTTPREVPSVVNSPRVWDSQGLEAPWMHKSGLDYRDMATIEAARSVARFAHNNQYLGSFKTRRGEPKINYSDLSILGSSTTSILLRRVSGHPLLFGDAELHDRRIQRPSPNL